MVPTALLDEGLRHHARFGPARNARGLELRQAFAFTILAAPWCGSGIDKSLCTTAPGAPSRWSCYPESNRGSLVESQMS